MSFDIRVLGPLAVEGNEPISLDRPSHRRLLSILALQAGRRVSTDVLIDRFWPDNPPETARAAIQTHISALRKVLGDGHIVTEGFGYRLDVSADQIDAPRFEAHEARARAGSRDRDWTAVLEASTDALALWRGHPYQELTDDEFARGEVRRLEEQYLQLLELRAEAMISMDRAGDALPDLEALVVEHPYRERLWEHLMTARYRLGRHTEALRAYQQVSEHLAEIGVEPGETLRRLEERILIHDRSLNRAKHNLPTELDSFVGRETEIHDITRLLADNRLVSLTGPGGSGKTRLAIHTARQVLDQYPDGIWYVELAPLSDPDQVATEIAQTLGIRPTDEELTNTIIRRLRDDTILLILDNCEHLEPQPAHMAELLLRQAPNLTILTTSRAALRTRGEAVYPVPGLSLPETASTDTLSHDAINLFIDRMSLHSADTPALDDLPSIVELCRRLDGLPLAIELAAARARSLSVKEVAQRLEAKFGLLRDESSLTEERHRTLEGAIDWSYQMLTSEQQTLFNRLSVFRGTFDLGMAERVAGGVDPLSADTIPSELSVLVEQSLITATRTDGTLRYRLLETLREFGNERLRTSGEYELAKNRHLAWANAYSDDALERNFGSNRKAVVDEIGVHLDNLLAAISWADQTGTSPALLRIVAAVHWDETGYLQLVEDQLTKALDTCNDQTVEAFVRSLLWRNHWALGRSKDAFVEARRAYELVRDEPASESKSLAIWVYVRAITLDLDVDTLEALPYADEGVAVALERNDLLDEVRARRNRSQVLVRTGHEDEALEEANQAVDLALEVGDSRTTILACYDAITAAMYSRSARRHEPRRLVDVILDSADSEEQVVALAADWLAQVYLQTGELDRAREILDKDREQSHLEGMDLESLLLPRTGLHWMEGDLSAAVSDLLAHEQTGVNPRWYQDYYAVSTEVYADLGDLHNARKSAHAYLRTPVHSSEEPNKLGALNPLVRAEVDAALGAEPDTRMNHVEAARGVVAEMERILAEFPPLHSGAPMWETHDTHLSIARAELSRLDRSDPDLWRTARDAADFIYYRLYAHWRLAEALLHQSDRRDGAAELKQVHRDAAHIGAALMRRRAEDTASSFQVDL